MSLLCAIWAPGVPRTKGSLDRRMQDTPQSKAWRRLVAEEVKRDMRVRGQVLDVPNPFQGPVVVRCVFVRPDDIGDVDKLARNVLDAISIDAKLIADDVQVVGLECYRAREIRERQGPGALVDVRTSNDDDTYRVLRLLADIDGAIVGGR